MNQFYHNIIIDKSFQLLQELRKKYNFILIGGWAVFLYSQALKSKDIDIILDYHELNKLKESYAVFKNERLKKYEIKFGDFDVDIYLPHYSDLGIDIEEIQKRSLLREGFNVPEVEILFILKLYAWKNRQGSIKGEKDELDILSLILLPEFNWQKYLDLIKTFKLEEYHQGFISFLKRSRRVKALGINEQKMSRLKKKFGIIKK